MQRANVTNAARSMTATRLYSCAAVLKGLTQDFEHVAAERCQFIQKEHAIVGQRHLPRHQYLPAPDQPCIRDRVVRSTKWTRADERHAVAGEAGDAMDAGGFNRFGQGHRRQDGVR